MEFIHAMTKGFLELLVLIGLIILSPFLRVLDSKRLNAFYEEICKKIFSDEI